MKLAKFPRAFKLKMASLVLMTLILIGYAPSITYAKEEKSTDKKITTERNSKINNGKLRVMVLSDIHLFPEKLIGKNKDFEDELKKDRKLLMESEGILNAAIKNVKDEKPDVLLIPGDLTKDGEEESHKLLSKKLLELKKSMTDLKIYAINGNHDINNHNAVKFDKGSLEKVPITTPEKYKEIYSWMYDDETVVERFTSQSGKAGEMSFVARPKNGFTFIVLDTAKYTADAKNKVAGSGDTHETGGSMSDELIEWTKQKISEANKRGDTVIASQHHGLVPHFTEQYNFFPMYLVDDYDKIGEVFSKAGLKYIFTGHFHINDIAKEVHGENNLYDIATGSAVTYPTPYRIIEIDRFEENGEYYESLDINTEYINNITFNDIIGDGQKKTIDNLLEYSKNKVNLSSAVVSSLVMSEFLDGMIDEILSKGGIEKNINGLIKQIFELGISENENIVDFFIKYLKNSEKPLKLEVAGYKLEITYNDKKDSFYININAIFTIEAKVKAEQLKETLSNLFKNIDIELLSNKEYIKTVIDELINEILNYEIVLDNKDKVKVLDIINAVYKTSLYGEENKNTPSWLKEAIRKIDEENFTETLLNRLPKLINDALIKLGEKVDHGITVGEEDKSEFSGFKKMFSDENMGLSSNTTEEEREEVQILKIGDLEINEEEYSNEEMEKLILEELNKLELNADEDDKKIIYEIRSAIDENNNLSGSKTKRPVKKGEEALLQIKKGFVSSIAQRIIEKALGDNLGDIVKTANIEESLKVFIKNPDSTIDSLLDSDTKTAIIIKDILKDPKNGDRIIGNLATSMTTDNNITEDNNFKIIEKRNFNPDDINPKLEIDRVSGLNRYETAVKLSREYFKNSETVIIASGEKSIDSLSSQILADEEKAPILLTENRNFPKEVKEETKRLGAKNILIVGGINTVSQEVENELKKDYKVNRISGNDRNETASLVAERYFDKVGNTKSVIIANGYKYADVLSSSSLSIKEKAPVLLTSENEIPEVTEKLMKNRQVDKVVVAGGRASVGEKVLGKLPKGYLVLSGDDRYETSVKISERVYPKTNQILLASGEIEVDALVAGTLTGKLQMPILLTQKAEMPAILLKYIKNNNIEKATVIGGEATVGNEQFNRFK